ncbi:MAG: hypothetical protein Q8P52_03260 [bacterium]|nr:hypothetical protein [bacterium]
MKLFFQRTLVITLTLSAVLSAFVLPFNPQIAESLYEGPISERQAREDVSAARAQLQEEVNNSGCLVISATLTPIDWNPERCVADFLTLFVRIAGIGLWLAGAVLDYTIGFTLNMNQLLTSIPIVNIGWTIFRDLANIVFIFLLLYISIGTILGLSSINTKVMLRNLILVALLINFSLFITKAVVDASNIAALHFYNLIGSKITDENGNVVAESANVSSAFMGALRLQTSYKSGSIGVSVAGTNFENVSVGNTQGGEVSGEPSSQVQSQPTDQDKSINTWNIILISFFSIILILVATFVFFAAAMLFAIRAVVLMLVMLLSPLAFVSMALPDASKYANQWWNKLFSQAFFAPFYMALIFVVVKTVSSQNFQDFLGEASFASAFTSGDFDSVGIIVNFAIIIILLLGTLLVAVSLGVHGGNTMVSWGKSAQKWGQGFAGSKLSSITGGVARKFSESATAEKMRAGGGVASRLALSTADKLQNLKIAGGRSYKESREKGTLLSPGENEIEANLRNFRSNPARLAQYISNLKGGDRKFAYEKLNTRDRAAVEQWMAQRAAGTVPPPSGNMGSLSQTDLAGLRGNLSTEEREKTEKSLIENELESRRGNAAQIGTYIQGLPLSMQQAAFNSLSAEDRVAVGAVLPVALNTQLRGNLTQEQRAKTERVERESQTRQQLEQKEQDLRVAANAASAQAILLGMSSSDVAKLDGNVLARPEVASSLDVPALVAIEKAGNLTRGQRTSIGVVIRGNPAFAAYLAGPAGNYW